jgi:ribosomal protein L29
MKTKKEIKKLSIEEFDKKMNELKTDKEKLQLLADELEIEL